MRKNLMAVVGMVVVSGCGQAPSPGVPDDSRFVPGCSFEGKSGICVQLEKGLFVKRINQEIAEWEFLGARDCAGDFLGEERIRDFPGPIVRIVKEKMDGHGVLVDLKTGVIYVSDTIYARHGSLHYVQKLRGVSEQENKDHVPRELFEKCAPGQD